METLPPSYVFGMIVSAFSFTIALLSQWGSEEIGLLVVDFQMCYRTIIREY